MPSSWKECSFPGCTQLVRSGRCTVHEQRAVNAKGKTAARGYTGKHRSRFREAVLANDPTCRICGVRPSSVADHWPLSRRQLVAAGLDPNDPDTGRGLCAQCDHLQTAQRQPGGWAAER